jgi:hypothetical protein
MIMFEERNQQHARISLSGLEMGVEQETQLPPEPERISQYQQHDG